MIFFSSRPRNILSPRRSTCICCTLWATCEDAVTSRHAMSCSPCHNLSDKMCFRLLVCTFTVFHTSQKPPRVSFEVLFFFVFGNNRVTETQPVFHVMLLLFLTGLLYLCSTPRPQCSSPLPHTTLLFLFSLSVFLFHPPLSPSLPMVTSSTF